MQNREMCDIVSTSSIEICPHCGGDLKIAVDEVVESVWDLDEPACVANKHTTYACAQCWYRRWVTETELRYRRD